MKEEIQKFRENNPDSIFGFAFYNSDIQQAIADNPEANGVRVIFGIDDNGNQTAYLEAANLPMQKESSTGIGGDGLLCLIYCS